ncbi:MAG: ATP-dependent DNA helicase RecG [Deltaproteobacteria bacterium CG11_big_fil_rev_8_21_14_0_20_49_13]|nr:MAG: ATP-dependent DNA helicase RecG [Deltaproteobacteria bacterium CG11_big_fil_rev_8_21_14_0_20_49_13]
MNDLQTSIQYIKGVGPRLASVLGNRRLYTVNDVLFHFPYRYIDRREITSIKDAAPGKERTIIGEVATSGVSFLGRSRKRIFEVMITDGKGLVSAKWFHFNKNFGEQFRKGTKVLFAGELTEYNGMKQFVHPETEVLGDDDSPEIGGKILPIYPLTDGVSQRLYRKIINNAWEKYSHEIKDVYPTEFAKRHELTGIKEAAQFLHFPPKESETERLNSWRTPAHRTIIFSEFFILELALAMRRASNEKEKGISFDFKKDEYERFLGTLPFELTGAQERVIREIRQDMANGHPMNRLLQGDVGSGKTVVALAAALQAAADGYQAVFMAPTEILAEQHLKSMEPIAEKLRVPCALLTASVKGDARASIYGGVAKGDIQILVGTHAVIQKDVKFAKLGLAIIDEQHRFGVAQRMALHKKGASPDVLVMTATPIPRTLAMTLYGDLEVSVLDELPRGRRPVITKSYSDRQREKLHAGIRMELERGHQAYVVYPLIEESEKIDLKNATEEAALLSQVFAPTYRVELLHGRMKQEEKERVMRDFKAGRVHILAATSIVEVGVDVPNATVMVVEHAERFGLAQLHQLRGRVGRGDAQSFCILICSGYLSEDGRARLNIMIETTDGFKIAEEDLKIRGPGEFLGTRQSGLPEFKLADLIRDAGMLQTARQAAFEMITEDPKLELPKNRPFSELMKERGNIELGKVA